MTDLHECYPLDSRVSTEQIKKRDFPAKLVLQTRLNEGYTEVRNHREGPYAKLGQRRNYHKGQAVWLA